MNEDLLLFAGTDSVIGPRSSNQDRAYADSTVMALFDGVSGQTRGDIAASLALAEVLRAMVTASAVDRFCPPLAALIKADDAIRELNLKTGMACATTGIVVAVRSAESGSPVAHVSWAGDSPAYLVRDGRISRLTHAHHQRTVSGQEDPHTLSKWLGGDSGVRPSTLEVPVQEGDRLVLVSDGVSGVLEDRRIGAIVASSFSPAEAAQMITSAALRNRTGDNATVVVAHLEGSSAAVGTATGVIPPPAGMAGQGPSIATSRPTVPIDREHLPGGEPPPADPNSTVPD